MNLYSFYQILSLKEEKGMKNRKKFLRVTAVLLLAALLASLMSFPAFAGWEGGPGHWWWRNSNGSYPHGGAATIDGYKYVFDDNGYVVENKWTQMSSGKWYYSLEGGKVATDRWIGNYYVGSDGYMLTDTWTPDGYYVDSNGKWVESKGNKSGGSTNFDMSKYELICGTYDNRDQFGFSKDHRVDCTVTLSDSHAYMYFGLYDRTGTGYDLYDKYDPNGDNLELYPGSDSFHWTAKSQIRGDSFSLEYNGTDQIILHWRHPSWLGQKDIVFKRTGYGY